MIYLKYDCKCSEPKIYPPNWKTAGIRQLKKDWYIFYRFYDPLHIDRYPNGKLCIVKGTNGVKDLEERKENIAFLLANEIHLLKNRAYNPITKHVEDEIKEVHEIEPTTSFVDAIRLAADKLKLEPTTKADLRQIIAHISEVAKKHRLDFIPISDIKRKHLKAILEQCAYKQNGEYSTHKFNKYRTYIMMPYKELLELETIDSNIVLGISKQKTIKRIRQVLSDDERIKVDAHLRQHHYRFWLFLHVFFHSGARETEMMGVRGKDVDIRNRTVKYLVKKGRQYREVLRPIKDIAVIYWMQAMANCDPNEFVFSKGLMPGETRIRTDQINKRWKRNVKDVLNITADFYSLKHSNSTETSDLIGTALAAKMNQHSEEILKAAYDVHGPQREMEILKRVNNTFAPTKRAG